MQKITPLEQDKFYHIYNCGINGENLFHNDENHNYFLRLYDKYINPIADTYAWCLMKNHFHFLIRIKNDDEILNCFSNLTGLKKIKPPHQYFSNLFNAYTKAINKRFERHGSLFERPFKRKQINSEDYLKNVIVYIHNNPVHHGFVKHIEDWQWTSYSSCISSKPTKLKRIEVLEQFGDVDNFKYVHQQKIEIAEIEEYLEL